MYGNSRWVVQSRIFFMNVTGCKYSEIVAWKWPSVKLSHVTFNCEAQSRIGKGWQSRLKALKLKPLPRAYTKVGCHHPPTTTHHPKVSFHLTHGQVVLRWDRWR